MTDKERISHMYTTIREMYTEEKPKIIKYFDDEATPRIINAENLCSQPTEGLLYDLDIDEASVLTVYKDPVRFVDQMAIVNVIKFLHEFYLKNVNKE